MRKGLGAATLAAALSLSLVAASSPSSPRGTAETRLFAVELDVDPGSELDLGQLPGSLDVLDAGTYASTDTDEARNALGEGAAYAEAVAVPLRAGTTEIGAVRASTSSGTQRSTSTGGSIGSLTGVIGAQIDPIVATASAAEDEASAVLGSLSAQLGALASVLDLDVDAEDVASLVDATHSASGVRLEVSGLSLALGDLIPADVLAQLPLSTILELLETLPVDLPVGADDAIDELQDAISAVHGQLTAVEGAGQAIEDAATPIAEQLDELDTLLATVQGIEVPAGRRNLDCPARSLNLCIPDLGNLFLSSGSGPNLDVALVPETVPADVIADALIALTALDGAATQLGASAPTECGSLPDATVFDDPAEVGTILAALDVMQACLDVLPDAVLDAIGAAVAAAVATLRPLVDALEAAVGSLAGLLAEVTVAAEGLLSIIDELLAALPDAAGIELLGIDGFDVGLSAVSTGATSTSHAVVGCSPVAVRVVNEAAATTPSCADGLQEVVAVADLIEDSLGSASDVLGVLPLADLAALEGLTIELFGALTETVVEDGDHVVATAGIEILELSVPSLTIDPQDTVSRLGTLELGNLLVAVGGVIDEAYAAVRDAVGDHPAVLPLLDELDALLAAVVDSAVAGPVFEAYVEALSALDALLAGLPEPLDVQFATPGFTLVIDPVATAEFAPAATAGAPDPSGSGDPTSGAPLPATGGGLALLGLVGIGGALALRKRR